MAKQLTVPAAYAEKFEAILSKELGKPAKLKRVDKDEKTTFSFYPTKGEVLEWEAGNTWENGQRHL